MSTSRATAAKARKRIASVFTYLQELHRVRTPPIVEIERYPWKMRMSEVPTATTVHFGARLAQLCGAPGESDDYLLRVERPEEVPCPEPPPVVRTRLATGWEVPSTPARMRTAPPVVVSEESDAFREVSAQQSAFDEWSARRDAWSAQQAPLALFLKLYDLWAQFERESEKFQLYFGDGILVTETDEGQVRHPLLLQRLELRFDPRIPAFTLTESDDSPLLYAPLLRHLSVDGKALLQLQQEFVAQGGDLLSGDGTDRYLKTLVHGLWPDGAFLPSREAAALGNGPRVYREPMLYLGHRSQDLAGSIDRYLERLADEKELPRALLRVVGIDTDEAEPGKADDIDLLLTRPANPEQQRVIRRLEETGAVLVQGPPGTGKSHTIANLIGHLLAENKSILVTSHASKALRVVRDQVAAPLQSLCVSVLDSDEDSGKQLEDSITGILNYFSQTTQHELDREIEELGKQRRALVERCGLLAPALRAAVAREYGTLDHAGERVPTADVVKELIEARGQHDWLPGPIHGVDPPLDDDEVVELYRLVATIQPGDERLARLVAPDLSRLPEPGVFTELCNARTRAITPDAHASEALWTRGEQSDAELAELGRWIAETGAIFDDPRPWLIEVLSDGARGRDGEEPWRELVELVRDCNARVPPRQAIILQHGPQVSSELPLGECIEICSQIVDKVTKSGGRLGAMAAMFKPEWRQFLRVCRVDSGAPETAEHFHAILHHLEIQAMRQNLGRRWDRQMGRIPGAPSAASLGPEPEKAALPHADAIARALNWSTDLLRPCERRLVAAGLDWPKVVRGVPLPAGPHGATQQLRTLLRERLPAIVAARHKTLSAHKLGSDRDAWLAVLGESAAGDLSLVQRFADAIKNGARAAYGAAWSEAQRVSQVGPAVARRDELLARLEPFAPTWAAALRAPDAPRTGVVPGAGSAESAWAYRGWADALARETATDVDALQEEVNQATAELQDATARYVEKLAWRAQFARTGLEQQQALAGWLALHKKIGSGSGKNAARLKEEAKKTLVKCREAVPVWIMPLSRVIESFDVATTRFDVVILDEASQCDVLGLTCFAMAREVAVVGDHEQVSPYAVGHKVDKIQGLIDELLDDIPNKQLYDGKTSVYDLARQSFGGAIRLLEHFRCVPEIIQFSNQLCYAGEIRPLREASSAHVKPPLVIHAVEHGQKIDKVNEQEAHEIAALVTAACEMPEYDGSTLGVISLVGTDQALFIDGLLRQRLPVSEYQRHRILCGNASQFQGDERDVIFLSMVDSPTADKRLAILKRDDAKKVFNVAASRARDQLWVVHSLDPARDLKPDDLRLKLLSHADVPHAGPAVAARTSARPPSAAEKTLADLLRARGFHAVLHVPIGHLTIDCVVEGDGGDRVAIQVDGGREQNDEQLTQSLERQLTLERIGWRFIRVRASALSLAPEATLAALTERLGQLGITRTAAAGREARASASELVARVKRRAEQIRRGSRTTLRAVSHSDLG